MAKKVQSYIKLQVAAGMATPNPPVGPSLGQHGVNIMEFCKKFNDITEKMEKGLPIPVIITVYSDRSFIFVTKNPPTAVLLKKAAGIESGSSKPNIDKIGKLTSTQIYEIAKIKSSDMNCANIESIYSSIVGTAYSLGLVIVEED